MLFHPQKVTSVAIFGDRCHLSVVGNAYTLGLGI